jgi:hypothetical protein
MKKIADVTGGKPIAILLQSIWDVSAINPLVAFYDIHGGKREVLFFYFVPDTTQDYIIIAYLLVKVLPLFVIGKKTFFFLPPFGTIKYPSICWAVEADGNQSCDSKCIS